MGYTDKITRSVVGAAAVSVIALIAGAGPALAQTVDASSGREFSVGQGPLADALRAISLRTGVPIIFSEALIAGHTTSGVTGYLGTEAALAELLRDTGLEAVPGAGGYVIRVQATGIGADPAQVGPARPPQPERVPGPSGAGAPGDETDLRIDRVTVTGTSLRGIAPESSPLQVYSREDILGSGVSTTEQFIRTLPQNFGGGSSEFTAQGLPSDTNSQRNDSYGAGANLRGLGAGATLTLINGGRLAPSSTIGDFVDLSMIPLTVIERVEVLTDGASSIYGGDAVAGVVNLVLRDDFRGAETALRYGSVTEGKLREVRLGQTVGTAWNSGNLMGTYEYTQRDRLSLSDRPGIAAPTLISGGSIGSLDRFDLLPEQERNSLVLSGKQSVGSRVRISPTLLYSERKVSSSVVGIGATVFNGEVRSRSESLAANLVADIDLSSRWGLKLDGGYSSVSSDRFLRPLPGSTGTEVRTETDTSLWSVGAIADGELFSLPGGAVQLALGAQYREEDLLNTQSGQPVLRDGKRDVAAFFGELHLPFVGEGNALPGVRRLEVNLSGRVDDYSDFGTTSNPRVGLLWSPVETLRIRSTYSTSFAPPKLGQSGALDRGAGVLSYDFIRGLLGIPLPDPSLDGVNYIIATGTAADLAPETSRAFTGGFDFERGGARGQFSLRGTYYNITFENRLGTTPMPGNVNPNFAPGFEFATPGLFPVGTVIFFPSEAQIAALIASLDRPLVITGGASAVENIGFINNVSLTRNLALTETSGFDLNMVFRSDTAAGDLTASLNANYILDFDQQASSSSPSVSRLNTLYNPVDLQIRGQLGLVRGAASGILTVNHVTGYRTDSTASGTPVRSWTTADLTLSYRFAEAGPGLLKGVSAGISVTNLFDRGPPPTPPLAGFSLTGYDPANASPLGRFVALDVRKSF